MNAKEILEKKRERFIEDRANNEREINNFMERVSKLSPKLLEKLGPLYQKNAKELVPSMWLEPFDENKYKEEMDIVAEYVSRVEKLADKLAERAEELLREA